MPKLMVTFFHFFIELASDFQGAARPTPYVYTVRQSGMFPGLDADETFWKGPKSLKDALHILTALDNAEDRRNTELWHRRLLAHCNSDSLQKEPFHEGAGVSKMGCGPFLGLP